MKKPVVVLLAPLVTAVLGAAPAETATTGCSLPVESASEERPHVDDRGDSSVTTVDVAWVGVTDGPALVDTTDGSLVAGIGKNTEVHVTFQPDVLAAHQSYVVTFDDRRGDVRFVSAEPALAGWTFSHGFVTDGDAGRELTRRGPTAGTMDVDEGELTISLVGDFQERPPADERRTIQLTDVTIQPRLTDAPQPPHLWDDTRNSESCEVVVHEVGSVDP